LISPVWAPPRRIDVRIAARELLLAQLVGRAAGVDRRLVEDLVGQQVPHAGDRALVHQPRFDRRRPAADARAELGARHLAGVGAYVGEVGLEDGAAQPALVAQRQAPAARELQREAIPPPRVGLGVDHDRPSHAQVQPQHRPLVGLHPQELAATVGVGDAVPGERRRDLAGRVGPAHVGVGVVHRDDLAPADALDLLARALGLGQLGQLSRTAAAGPAARAR
jgi:hypothetical protein